MTCILADDEEPARLLLQSYISKTKELNLLGSFSNGLEARDFLEKNKVDLVFLDINMPELSGLSVARIVQPRPIIIFTTAYSEYASEGFELDVIDYLTKPFSLERFLKSVNKARQYHEFNNPPTAPPSADYFFVKADYKMVKINFAEIEYIEGMREYVRIHLIKKKVVTLLPMTKMESILPADRFLRVHKSSIVNLDFIDAIHGNEIELGPHRISIGATYKESVEQRLKELGIS